jgi:hypothetical protein
VQPGWAIADNGLPQPCNKGTYGPGGSAVDAKGVCIECPAGWTTAESGESSITDCKGKCDELETPVYMYGAAVALDAPSP